jgi:hypothetical protein
MTDRLDSQRLAREGRAPRYRLEAAVDEAVPDHLDRWSSSRSATGAPTGAPKHGRGPTTTAAWLEQARAQLAKDEAKSDREPSL